MLKQRVLTAIVLLLVLVPSVFLLPDAAWVVLSAVIVSLGAWEWGGLLGWRALARQLMAMLFLVVCVGIGLAVPALSQTLNLALLPGWCLLVYGLSVLFWLLMVPLWMKGRWLLGSGVPGVLVGMVVLLPTWLAFVQLRSLGPVVLIGLMAIVWVADIAAYFTGRAFGKRKLAPQISPGKTWEGALGAVAGVMLYGVGVHGALGFSSLSMGMLLPLLGMLTAVSIIGDLFESLLKRQAGIKDSSNLLPGHGGVLDRIDSLTSTLPILAFLLILGSRL